MTYEEIRLKLLARWWLILAFTIGFTFVFFPWSSSTAYKASIGLGISFNNPAFIETDNQASNGYVSSLKEFSLYLANRFRSVEVQSSVAKKAGLGVANFTSVKAFYDVTDQGGGFITISYDAPSQEVAQTFINVIQDQYNQIITIERSNNQLPAFQITPNTQFITDISEVRRPTQFRLLPSVAGVMLGLAIAIIAPYRITKKNPKNKSK
jgi:hypothetical protein